MAALKTAHENMSVLTRAAAVPADLARTERLVDRAAERDPATLTLVESQPSCPSTTVSL
jgi:hypothetical protein